MYSMVMAMALSGTAALPAHGGHGCHGSYGCSGYSSCSGYGYGCSGSCHGSGHRLFSCFNKGGHGCHGGYCSGYSCSGYSGYGCSGSCHGGGHRLFSCFNKGHGCHGSCSGYSCSGYGCNGWNNCCGTRVVASCCGCTGGYAAPMGAPVMGAPMGAPAGAAPQAAPAPAEKRAEPKPPAAFNGAAKMLVSLPADAVLTIDGQATTSTGAAREFASPVLEAGRDYVYTLKASLVRDGKTVEESQTVRVRAGETSEVSFGLTTVAAN